MTLSEARSDALRNRLFQTGHAVEKVKRVAIGNLALESLAPGHHRALSDAEVATLLRLVQPSSEAVAAPRRPRIKRRPFTPKPKPGRKSQRPALTAQHLAKLRRRRNFFGGSSTEQTPKKLFAARKSIHLESRGFNPADARYARSWSSSRSFEADTAMAAEEKPLRRADA